MKKLLLGIIAINLTFISALALAEDDDSIFDDTSGKITATVGDAEESGGVTPDGNEDINLINANTTGAITLGGGEDSGEGEESDEDANLNDLDGKTDVDITGAEDHTPDGA